MQKKKSYHFTQYDYSNTKYIKLFHSNSTDSRTGTSSDKISPLIKANMPACMPAPRITKGSSESIVPAPPGAMHISLDQRASRGISTKLDTSRSILAKKATAPSSVLYSVLITTEERLYQPSPEPTNIES